MWIKLDQWHTLCTGRSIDLCKTVCCQRKPFQIGYSTRLLRSSLSASTLCIYICIILWKMKWNNNYKKKKQKKTWMMHTYLQIAKITFIWFILTPHTTFSSYHAVDKFSRWQTDDICSYFFLENIGSGTSCKVSLKDIICMKWPILFSRKIKIFFSKCHLLKFFPGMQSVQVANSICNLPIL